MSKKYQKGVELVARNNKVSVFLKDCLADALIKLMKEKPFEKITVDEIAQSAGVGRATYFRNFSSKQEVLTYRIVRFWEINAEQRNLKERRRFDISNTVDFFEINYLQKDVFDVIYAAGQQSALYDAFYKIMIPAYDESPTEKYSGYFFSYGLFGTLDKWIKSGYSESPRQMAQIIEKIINGNI